ncbi:MAG: hypothetical protein RL318_2573 [Fibrobacterota bacterium]|jgi:hypothetical protein
MPDIEAGLALSKAWVQGSFLSEDLVARLWTDAPSGCLGVVASHSCDLANGSLEKEPWVEWIPAWLIAKADKSRTRSRNPRELHLPAAGPGGTHLALHVKERRIDSRTVLLGVEPSGGLDDAATLIFSTWMSRRYARTALPDAFNDRRACVASDVRKLLDRGSHEHLSGLWAMLPTQEDLPEGEAYRITLRGTVAKGAAPAEIAMAKGVFEEIVTLLDSCSGIEVGHDELRSEERFPLSDLELFQRLDDWDDLSRG